LAGEGVDEIYADIVETGSPGCGKGAAGLVGGMNPSQKDQLLIVKGLEPQRKTIHAGPTIGRKSGFIHCAGVGFKGDLGVTGECVLTPGGVKKPLHQVRGKKRGSSAPQVKCCCRRPFKAVSPQGHFCADPLYIGGKIVSRQRNGGKVAVEALAQAEGDVYVEREGHVSPVRDDRFLLRKELNHF
jgi:hypothetical protein